MAIIDGCGGGEEQYGKLARVYDNFMYDVSYEDWADYIDRLIVEHIAGGAAESILEYACGTGSLTLELVKRGYGVTAVDISNPMLGVAAEKLRKNAARAVLVEADMTGFRLNKPADAAVCACDGVNYITDEGALRCFFKNACANIRPGGAFLFDISSRHKLMDVIGTGFFYDDSDEGTVLWQNTSDEEAATVTMDITLFEPCGGLYGRYDERHVQKAWSAELVLDALRSGGFTEAVSYGFATRRRESNEAERIQFIAKKGIANE